MMKKTTFGAVLAFLFAAAGALTAAASISTTVKRAGRVRAPAVQRRLRG